MKKSLRIFGILTITLLLTACQSSQFDGSRTGNDSQFIMEYKIFDTSDAQQLTLESGDEISAEIVVDSGKLSIEIQKDEDDPIYKSDGITVSNNFDVEIPESGTYTIRVTGEKTRGSVSFVKISGEKEEKEEE